MSRRFQSSKYKNAAPKASKHEAWMRDLVIGSYNCSGNFIKASAAFAAFNVQPTGSQLAVVSLESEKFMTGSNIPILNAHSDLVTDLDFSPFEDGLLATCSADSTVKIWSITPDKLSDLSTLSPEWVTSSKHRRVENVCFNPTVDFLLSYSSQNTLTLWDVLYNKEIYHDNSMHNDTITTHCWSHDGNLVVTGSKDKNIRIVDPRDDKVVSSATSHTNAKDSRVLWLGDSNYVLSTGFDTNRMRQIFLRDTRSFGNILKTVTLDSSTGILIPLYDPDTKMLFVAGRGDASISYMEFSEHEPYLTDGFRLNGEQTKGACLVSKRALRVMDTEVNRIIQLTGNSVYVIPYHVPRKSYVTFHNDLFPETRGVSTSGRPSLWLSGLSGTRAKTSLDPKTYRNGDNNASLVTFKKSLSIRKLEESEKTAEFLESDLYKKSVPEARPRKKSLSSSGSSSDEVNDILVGRSVPVPRPRVANNGTPAVSQLRTPSSFLTKRAADFSRSYSLDERGNQEHHSTAGPPSLPNLESSGDNSKQDANVVNNNSNTKHDAEGTHLGNGHCQNGNSNNGHGDQLDGQAVSGLNSERRKGLEARSVSVQEGDSTGGRKPRLTVAERLKLFQSKESVSDEPSQSPPRQKLDSVKPKPEEHVIPEPKPTVIESSVAPMAKPERKISPPAEKLANPTKTGKSTLPAKRIDTVFGQVSKYRNFKAVAVHKKFHIDNLRSISTTCPSESELIQANPDRIAVPLNTPAGKLAIFEISKPGRQPDGVVPSLVHGTKIMDFMWDPFNPLRLAVGCDDGRLFIWILPTGGLKEPTNEPQHNIYAHAEKVYFVRFHPLAQDILATGSYDRTIRLWNLSSVQEVIQIHLSSEQVPIFTFAWSPCGSKFATANKDGMLRVYDPRLQTQPIVEGNGPVGRRGGRVCWVLEGKFLVVAGFDKSSERQVLMYKSQDLSLVSTVSLDVSPSILVPFYDEDSSILLLSGRGDSTIFAFDVVEESPYLRQVSNHRCPGVHQGLAFLKKSACDVKNVEFVKALRLTETSVEPWSFTVPRVKSEFFQDDLFPPTKLLWEPTMSSSDWLAGHNVEPRRISLRPASMKSLGELNGRQGTVAHNESISTPATSKVTKPVVGLGGNSTISDVGVSSLSSAVEFDKEEVKRQQDRIENSMKSKLLLNMKLEQDSMEGVDESEWNE